ncbi:MAG: type II toxin-antitoxin system RelE/ParE family toxin [Lachnospiraceae bacterium]|nr:type II toxin-antitoxin system RelE/ParE family toxin [Lachnospiraceae bacterium]
MDKPLFNLIILKEAEEFINALDSSVIRKMFYNIDKIAGGVKDPELFKKLGDTEIWEFRTLWMGMAYRLFAFWDKDEETLIVATHGLIKKTQKTPKSEIKKAQAIRKEYFENKEK